MPDQVVQDKPRFTNEEKCKYFAQRINDVNISAGQRRYAAERLNALLGATVCTSSQRKNLATGDGSPPAYMDAKAQFDEILAYHERRRGDPYSLGYTMGAGNYELYQVAGEVKDATPEYIKEFRDTVVNSEHARMRELAKHRLLSDKEDPYNLKNAEIIEARGYMKALGDAAKARKGILLK